jgi:hypothetical protein
LFIELITITNDFLLVWDFREGVIALIDQLCTPDMDTDWVGFGI